MLYRIASSSNEALSAKVEDSIVRAWVEAGLAFAEVLVAGLLGVYFLRNGRGIHKLLMR